MSATPTPPPFPHTGGEEEYFAAREGKEPPKCHFKPKMNNIAPRSDGWQKTRNNTQQPPRSGPVSEAKGGGAGSVWLLRDVRALSTDSSLSLQHAHHLPLPCRPQDSSVKPEAVQERGPMFGRPIQKMTAS